MQPITGVMPVANKSRINPVLTRSTRPTRPNSGSSGTASSNLESRPVKPIARPASPAISCESSLESFVNAPSITSSASGVVTRNPRKKWLSMPKRTKSFSITGPPPCTTTTGLEAFKPAISSATARRNSRLFMALPPYLTTKISVIATPENAGQAVLNIQAWVAPLKAWEQPVHLKVR